MEKQPITINIGSLIKEIHINTDDQLSAKTTIDEFEKQMLQKLKKAIQDSEEADPFPFIYWAKKEPKQPDAMDAINTKKEQARKIMKLSGELNKEINRGKELGLQIDVKLDTSAGFALNQSSMDMYLSAGISFRLPH